MGSNDLTKIAVGIAIVAGGVMAAGWVMNKFQGEVPFLADASNGFQGI